MDQPLEGIRVLSMEQAAALPFAMRHLADLGAEVIRVESHARARPPAVTETDLARNKLRWGLDLNVEGAPELFRRVAANVDVVAHNFTPRVMRKFGIDFESIRAVNPDVVYLSITGFGTTGPWGERPLFGPGAEAVSGHNLLIGEADAWPGRPGTIVYADNNTGLNAVVAILAALDHRDETGEAVHIDLSLYEAAIAHLGVAVTERAFGGELPARNGNADPRYLVHDVFAALGTDRHVAIAAREDDRDALGRVLGIDYVSRETVAGRIASMTAEDAATALQEAGVAAHVASDAADQSADAHLWARGYFGLLGEEDPHPHQGPAFGGGIDLPLEAAHFVGQDNQYVLSTIAGLSDAEIGEAEASGAVGAAPGRNARPAARPNPEQYAVRIQRGELARVEDHPDRWRELAR
ncbi:MAG: CaiB/BaiF CoA transferase family protein [Dehalococcoidia bacterium]